MHPTYPEAPVSQRDQNPTVNPSPAKGIDRRTVIQTAGVVGVGAVGLAAVAACGGSADTATPKASDTGGGAAGDSFKVAEIPVGGGKIFADAKVVVTQPKAGEFKAFSAVCTHQGCIVAAVANGTINCACHGSKYDITTGQVKAGPAPAALPGKTATVKGDSVTVT
jgi:Rieske Fe-S protein